MTKDTKPGNMFRSICIFLPTGKTFTFKDVTINHVNETAVSFNYKAMSDGREKRAVFLNDSIAGWSLTRYDN
jgi:hypothetical protein